MCGGSISVDDFVFELKGFFTWNNYWSIEGEMCVDVFLLYALSAFCYNQIWFSMIFQ